ncbi:Endonuclease/Exonuclease/phosphatase family protein [compost metagenome]
MDSELMMFYNVENFYPPNQDSADVSSFGLYNWDEYKYNQKIHKISNVFRYIEEDYGQLPSVIGLAEIGAKSVLENLTDENSPIHNYEIIYQQSRDSRGLSVALLFDKRKYTLVQSQILHFQRNENLTFDTRDILHAELLMDGKRFHIFVLHLPSKRNRDIKKQQRDYILKKLHETVQGLAEKKEAVVVIGDFNDNPDAEAIQQLCFDKKQKPMLNNPFEALYEKQQFTTYHGRMGVCFDQILWTEDHLKTIFNFQTITAEIYNNSRLRNKSRKNNNFPLRTYSGSRYMGGWSDHFPVIIKLEK